ncbi:MAG: Na+:solute symporter [Saprospiraceae bacterium]|nr:Na+:solute symporter [Saprospiraceae bacterium]
MKITGLDLLIIFGYLAATVIIGLLLRKRARQDNEAYLLGGKKLPWYMLGLSNASDMFDISGTMWMVTICFVYGMNSVWIPWLWPCFNQIFLMMYLSRWLRRSGASTGAEWLQTRFGTGPAVQASHTVVVAFAVISCLGFMAYGFVGLGKFIEIFIPWEAVAPYLPFDIPAQYVGHFYGILFTLFAVFYSVLGGMSGIVLGDVIMYSLMTIAAFSVAGIAMHHLSLRPLAVPEGWLSPFFSWNWSLDWTNLIAEANQKITADGFSPFGFFFMMMLFKGALASLAGPAPNYDMQKILSTRSPEEASKMSGFVSVVLMPIRYAMIIGFTVLALLYYDQLNLRDATGAVDFEKILPAAINQFIPVGLMGIVLAGLLAAFMGTFAGTLNAAQAYIVNDIYLKYIRPQASARTTVSMNYIVGISVVAISIVLGLFAGDVNTILQWIVSALYGGYVAANVLRWYWWRFNANGFFWGMLTGTVAALILPLVTDGLPLYWFPLLFLVSLAGSIAGTLSAPPTDMETLKKFYQTVRPWGFWKPVHEAVVADTPGFQGNPDFKLDIFNVFVGIVSQIGMALLPMYLILGQTRALLVTVAVLLLCALILKRSWWDRLTPDAPAAPPPAGPEGGEKVWRTIV